MNGRVLREQWDLISADDVAIPAGNRANGIAGVWSPVWRFKVPIGQSHYLVANLPLSAEFRDGAGVELPLGTTQVRISLQDMGMSQTDPVFGPVLYPRVREFTHKDKKARILVDRTIKPAFFLIVEVNSSVVAVEANSKFSLGLERDRITL